MQQMKILITISCLFTKVNSKRRLSDIERLELCNTLECDDSANEPVCGMRTENGQNSYKLFENECLLLKYGCQADKQDAYGIINLENCNQYTLQEKRSTACPDCLNEVRDMVCGIRTDGDGFRIRIFDNNCELAKYNCQKEVEFIATDYFICEDHDTNFTVEDTTQDAQYLNNELEANTDISKASDSETIKPPENKNYSSIIVVRGSTLDLKNINQTIDNFFKATHVKGLSLQKVNSLKEDTRRMLVKNLGPVEVFKPWVRKPANVSEDHWHMPTIQSCFHKCPKKCPDTYAPVCGQTTNNAREPSLMFQNHCFMDVAQCKTFWEDKSETAQLSAYLEASFLFCLGDTINGLYRFLPLIRTLQHMGRMKKKGEYHYKFRNMKFLNQYLRRDMKPMG